MIPVISPKAMYELEKGSDTAKLMDEVARFVADFINQLGHTSCLIFAGPGNNGKDALLAGKYLVQKGIPCAIYAHDQPLPETNHSYSCCIDGIFGTGFHGEISDHFKKCITWLNSQKTPIFSIDTPSGLNCATGEALHAVQATYTLSCHAPKLGLFIQDGWKHTGKLINIPLSLPTPESRTFLLSASDIHLPKIERTRNKYSAGAVVGVAGSLEMAGASLLAAEASLKVGAGIVRLFTPKEAFHEIAPMEVIRIPIETDTLTKWKTVFEKADSAFIGPGLGRNAKNIFDEYYPHLPEKRVVDGDGLFFVREHNMKGALLTPHLGEMSTLLGHKITITEAVLEEVRAWVMKQQCTLILKGAPTFIFSDSGTCYIMPRGDPALAKAGTGDVLTGMAAGLLAQKCSVIDAAIVSTWLHGRAGEIAAVQKTSYGVVASDLLNTMSHAIAEIIL